jgi:hypothetical protein
MAAVRLLPPVILPAAAAVAIQPMAACMVSPTHFGLVRTSRSSSKGPSAGATATQAFSISTTAWRTCGIQMVATAWQGQSGRC